MALVLTFILVFTITAAAQQESNQTESQENQVVATIDGEEIYMNELNQATNLQQTMVQIQNQNPQFVRFLYTSQEGQRFLQAFQRDRLNYLIARRLLEREAERENITLTEADEEEYFNEQIEMIKQQNDMNQEELENALQQQGISSLEDFKQRFIEQQRSNLVLQKFIEEVVLEEINISDEEAREVYEQGQFDQSFENMKDQIKRDMAQQEYIDQLKEEAEIEILLNNQNN